MPADELPFAHIDAVLARGCITELRYPRFCANRHCRRHKRCCDVAARDPRCAKSLHPIDFKSLVDLMRMAGDILQNRYPPHPSDDPVMCAREDEAICALLECYDDLPWYQDHFDAWYARYSTPPTPPAPPAPPAPKIDTGKLLAEMKARLERDRMLSETRAETRALKQRIEAGAYRQT